MSIFHKITSGGHEEVIFHNDAPSGLRAIVAIHSTLLGPAVGGRAGNPTPQRMRRWRTCSASPAQ